MHVWIPEAIHKCGSDVVTLEEFCLDPHNMPDLRRKLVYGVSMPSERVRLDEEPYFIDTDHRPLNDCVHSKRLLEGEAVLTPSLLAEDGLFMGYAKYYNYFMFVQFPMVDEHGIMLQPYMIAGGIGTTVLCRDNYCLRVQSSPPSHKSGTRYCDLVISLYIAVPGQIPKVYYKQWKLTFRCKMSHKDVLTAPYPHTDYAYDYLYAYTGNFPFPVDGNVYHALGVLICTQTRRELYWSGTNSSFVGDPDFLSPVSDIVSSILPDGLKYLRDTNYKGWSYMAYNPSTEVKYPGVVPPYFRFAFHEPEWLFGKSDPYLANLDTKGMAEYWLNTLQQQAYLDALNHVPTLNDNSISNILEIAGFIKSLVIDHRVELPKRLGDIWLSYRYQYTTTKLDAEEAIDFVNRYSSLGTLDKWIKCFGSATTTLTGPPPYNFEFDIICRCALSIRPKDVALLGRIWRALYTYGLQPNFYVVWDMIPYSFIVDWLIPIGNLAKAMDAEEAYSGTYYEISDVTFSLSYDITDEYLNKYHQYARWWARNGVTSLNGFYFLETDPASNKVKGMRALDVLSLFIGKGKK